MNKTLKRLLPDWLLLIVLGKAVGSFILLGF
jgi:hypothetical protein